ncbi:CAAX protease family protein [Paractinoplanes abujensis]|uniref:Membrane protease YdiL (CAAX protease family) n=1 Tax=Paractinoplanes abujensis TaxID=882441 RepID=A0A7W7CS17_9ACTN|nr:type II CAAX endopeptidase family protein [Actinoplanes abujensis]MBB4693632.1 membrane protease YdiL (CAAX protease family) [Actinoplanes abujensis]GID21710.1 CAAX protease family protein [Actinoplanes abujensis]
MNSAWLRRALGPSLIDRVERDHQQTDQAFRRRRIVVAFTLVAGAVLLGISLSVRPGDDLFYLLTVLVAATWIIGALLSGPLHLGRIAFRDRLRRPIITPMVTGLVLGAVFVTGSLIVREIPALRELVNSVLAHARYGAIVPIAAVTLLNGVAEEVFFRGALFAAIGRRHAVLISTVIYAAATVATGNLMLVFAAALLGFVLGLQRRASGGILAPILTHVTWSTTMLFALPALIHQ